MTITSRTTEITMNNITDSWTAIEYAREQIPLYLTKTNSEVMDYFVNTEKRPIVARPDIEVRAAHSSKGLLLALLERSRVWCEQYPESNYLGYLRRRIELTLMGNHMGWTVRDIDTMKSMLTEAKDALFDSEPDYFQKGYDHYDCPRYLTYRYTQSLELLGLTK